MNKQGKIENYLDEVLGDIVDEFYADANPIPSIRKRILRGLTDLGAVIKHGEGEADLWVEPLVGR